METHDFHYKDYDLVATLNDGELEKICIDGYWEDANIELALTPDLVEAFKKSYMAVKGELK